MPTKQEVDNAIKALKIKCICGDSSDSMQEHLSVIEQLSFSYFEDKNETEKMLNRKEYYKHEYFAECDRAEMLEKALYEACEMLEVLDLIANGFFKYTLKRAPISKSEWLKALKGEWL